MDIFKVKFSTEIDNADIYKIFSKNYSQCITGFLEFQRTWMNRAYLTFNDLDKYLIFMSLISRTFKSYSEYFIKYNFDEFYSIDEYELKKFNIVNISKELDIRKETARRKILELEKTGFIKKNKKAISIIRSAYSIEKPTNSIASLSKFMSSISKLLKKSNRIKNEISPNDFEYLIKKNFTQCWNFFLTFQIEYLTNFKKKFFKDYESVSIFFMIVYNQNLNLNKNTKNNPNVSSDLKESYVDKMISLTRVLGLNAMSISDLTGIPRPTVIRKLDKLIKSKWVTKDKNGLFSINANQNFTEINHLRLKNIERISDMVSKFFNAARLSKSKKN